jgi:hypothetical protein
MCESINVSLSLWITHRENVKILNLGWINGVNKDFLLTFAGLIRIPHGIQPRISDYSRDIPRGREM